MAPRRPGYPRPRLLLAPFALVVALSSCTVGRTRAFLGASPPSVAAGCHSSPAARPSTLPLAAKRGGKKSRPRSKPTRKSGGGSLGFGSRPGDPPSDDDDGGDLSSSGAAGSQSQSRSQSDSPVHSELILWIKSNGDARVSPKFAVRPSDLGGYGGFATAPFKRDEVVLRIPRSMCVTYDDALSDSKCLRLCVSLFCTLS